MINPFTDVNWKPGSAEIRKFGRTLLIGFFCIALLFFAIRCFSMPVAEAVVLPAWIFGIGGGIGVLALLIPPVAKPFYYLWYALSCTVGIAISNTILIVFFYALFTPFVLVLRLITRRDPLALKKPNDADSYWHKRNIKRTARSYLKQY